jgi:drug/metabolite transporter (DMT)-like permease
MPPLITLWIVWGSTYMGVALVVQSMPPLVGAGTRFLAATALLAAVVALFKGVGTFRMTWAQFRGASLLGVVILGVGIGMVSLAERYVPSSIAALVVSVVPLWIIIFRVHAGDRPSRLTLTGVGVGLVGLALMLLPGGTQAVGDANATEVALWTFGIACGSFSWAFFSWRSTRYAQPDNPLVTSVVEMFSAGLALVLVGVIMGESWDSATITASSWGGWIFLVFASAIAYSAYVWLIGHAPMSLVSTYAYVNPVIAVLLGFFILKESITTDVVLGLTIVVGGVVLVVSGERRPTKPGRTKRQ